MEPLQALTASGEALGSLVSRWRPNVADPLRLAAVRRPGAELLLFEGRRFTCAEANERANRIADALHLLGVVPGDPVVSIAYNSDRLFFLYFALAKLGAVNVPLSPMLTPREIGDALRKSGARVVLFGAEFLDVVRATDEAEDLELILVDDRPVPVAWSGSLLSELEKRGSPLEIDAGVGGDQPATIIFTSGTTGTPKGCVKSHSNQVWSAVNCQLTTPRSHGDVELFAIPLSGIGFANFVLAAILGGSRIVLSRFDPEICMRLIEEEKVTHAFLAGTMLAAMLDTPGAVSRDTRSLRVLETSYHLSERLRSAIADRFGEVVYYCGGSSEGSMSAAPPECFLSQPKCVGFPLGLDLYRVVDEDERDVPPGTIGEILVSGPTVMLGYFGDPDGTAAAFTEDGWLRSGDLGRFDKRGYMHFEGRKKDMIKSGGMSVLAGEVELILARHEGVEEAAVIGVPDDRWGEAVRAIVVPAAPAAADVEGLEEALRLHCRAELAGFKRPKDYVFVAELPKNPGGKVAKGQIATLYGEPSP